MAETSAPQISGKSSFDGPASKRDGWRFFRRARPCLRTSRDGARVNGRALVLSTGLLFTAFTTSACGNAIYAFQSSSAAAKLQQARDLQAEKLAAYEYYMAVEYLKQASVEAAEADYGDAIEFAEISEVHSDKAIELSRGAHRGAGR